MPAAMPVAIEGTGMRDIRAYIGIQRVNYPEAEAIRKLFRRFFVGIDSACVPAFRENAVLNHQGRIFHIAVRAVIVKDNLDSRITGVKGVRIRSAFPVSLGLHLLTAEPVAEGIRLPVAFLCPEHGARQ
jgi:hypothetical protein